MKIAPTLMREGNDASNDGRDITDTKVITAKVVNDESFGVIVPRIFQLELLLFAQHSHNIVQAQPQDFIKHNTVLVLNAVGLFNSFGMLLLILSLILFFLVVAFKIVSLRATQSNTSLIQLLHYAHHQECHRFSMLQCCIC